MNKIDQKYLYLNDCADLYYQSSTYQPLEDIYIKFISKFVIDNKIKKMISLGCGNSFEEYRILSKIKKQIEYIGVDFSQRMLELSKDILDKNKYTNYKLLNLDFFDKNIYKKSNQKKLYYISGFTMGNLNKTEIVKLIDNLNSGDFFVFYVISAEDPFFYKDFIEETTENMCDNQIKITQYCKGLSYFGLNKEDGDFKQIVDTDEISVVIRYNFVLKNKEEIKVQEIRLYSNPKLIETFSQANCQIIKIEQLDETDTHIFYIQKK